MGMGLIGAAMLSGVGKGVGDVIDEAQKQMGRESLEKARNDAEALRNDKNIAAASQLQRERQEFEASGKTAQAAEDVRNKPENVTARVAAEKAATTGTLQTKVENAPLQSKVTAQEAQDKVDAEAKRVTDLAGNKTYVKAEGILANAKLTDLQHLQAKYEKFKVDHQEEDRNIAIKKADDVDLATIVKSSEANVHRLNLDKTKIEGDPVASNSDVGQAHLRDLDAQIKSEEDWGERAKTALASGISRMPKKAPVTPTPPPKTLTQDQLQRAAEDPRFGGDVKKATADAVRRGYRILK